MGKAVGNDVALSLFLQAVVADGFGGKHRFLNVRHSVLNSTAKSLDAALALQEINAVPLQAVLDQ